MAPAQHGHEPGFRVATCAVAGAFPVLQFRTFLYTLVDETQEERYLTPLGLPPLSGPRRGLVQGYLDARGGPPVTAAQMRRTSSPVTYS
jgi:hypothetical protein